MEVAEMGCLIKPSYYNEKPRYKFVAWLFFVQ
jgi:hypothetical protein